MRAVQGHFPYNSGRGDPHLRKSAVSFDDPGGARNSKPAILLCNCTFHVRSPSRNQKGTGRLWAARSCPLQFRPHAGRRSAAARAMPLFLNDADDARLD